MELDFKTDIGRWFSIYSIDYKKCKIYVNHELIDLETLYEMQYCPDVIITIAEHVCEILVHVPTILSFINISFSMRYSYFHIYGHDENSCSPHLMVEYPGIINFLKNNYGEGSYNLDVIYAIVETVMPAIRALLDDKAVTHSLATRLMGKSANN